MELRNLFKKRRSTKRYHISGFVDSDYSKDEIADIFEKMGIYAFTLKES